MFNLELEQVRDLNSEMRKYYRPMPKLAHIQSVPNTMIACRTCRGQRVIAGSLAIALLLPKRIGK